MVRVMVDRERCSANGVCTAVAPQIFTLDEHDQLTVSDVSVGTDLFETIREAVRMCPTAALSLHESSNPTGSA